jgi:flagellar protein FlbD
MIELTRLNGRSIVLNCDLIKTVEASPDTMLTLINGEKLIIREGISEVVERVLAYRARLLAVIARRLEKTPELESAVALTSVMGLELSEREKQNSHPTTVPENKWAEM